MILIPAHHKLYNFDPQAQVVSWIYPGDNVVVETTEAPDGQINNEKDLITDLDIKRANPVTGPIGVVGSKPGDLLVIDIKKIQTADLGYMGIAPGEQLLDDFIKEAKTSIFKLKNNKVIFNSDRSYPLKPMVGVIGTTPNKKIKTNLAGPHGGNLDNRFITNNSRVYLPIFLEGALFCIGDIHAAMGDGEVIGCGIEAAGKVSIKVNVLKNIPLNFPIVATKSRWMITGEGWPLEEALKVATRRMLKILTNYYMFSKEEAILFLGSYAHYELCQFALLQSLCQVTVRIAFDNDVLNFRLLRNELEKKG